MFNFTMQGQSICPSGPSSSSTSPPKNHKNKSFNNMTSKRWRKRRTWNMGALLTLHPPNFHVCHKCPKTFPTSQALGGHQNAHRNHDVTNTNTKLEKIIIKTKNKKLPCRRNGKKITKQAKGKGKKKVTTRSTTTFTSEAGTSGGVSGQKDGHLAFPAAEVYGYVVSEGGGGGTVVIFGVPFGGGPVEPEGGVGEAEELNLLPGRAELEVFLAEEARDLEGAASVTLSLFPETRNGNHQDFNLKL